MSWKYASNDTRKYLFEQINSFRIDEGMDWETVIKQALGISAYSDSFVGNLRRGIMGRSNCQKLHSWLSAVNPTASDQIDIELSKDADTTFVDIVCKRKTRTVTETWTYVDDFNGVPIVVKEVKTAWSLKR